MSSPSNTLPLIYDAAYEDFASTVVAASNHRPILVDFWADWCAPCHALSPHLERAIGALDGRVSLAKVEVDEGENMRLAGQFKLRGFPSVLLFQHGQERARFNGARSSHQILDWLSSHLMTADADQTPG